MRSSSICLRNWGSFYFPNKLKLSSICRKNWGCVPIWVLIYSCRVTWSTFTEKCWKINFIWCGCVGVGAGLMDIKANSHFKLRYSLGWACQYETPVVFFSTTFISYFFNLTQSDLYYSSNSSSRVWRITDH